MSIISYTEDANYYRIALSDGSIWNVGKWANENPNGAATYEEACNIVAMNNPELIL